jgi:phosphinothricin acetyltransferase
VPDVTVRFAQSEDAAPISEIYNHYVRTSVCTFQTEPDTVLRRLDWLRRTELPPVVATHDKKVVGWGALSFYNARTHRTVWDSIYVHHDMLGQGIGSLLLTSLIKEAREHGCHSMVAGVNQGQERSYALHKKFGFQLIGTVKEASFKNGQWVDQRIMQLML